MINLNVKLTCTWYRFLGLYFTECKKIAFKAPAGPREVYGCPHCGSQNLRILSLRWL